MNEGEREAQLDGDRWAEVRRALKTAEDNDGAWWDKNEIREAIVRANAMDIEPSIVLACYQACTSHAGLVRRIDRAITKRKKRILAIDDDEDILEMVKLNLEGTRRYEVRVEADPSEAIGTALEFMPDVLLIDVMMPAKNGMDLLAEIRDHDELSGTPAIMVTALADQLEAGGVASEGVLYLSKPASTKKLIYCIEELVKAGGPAAGGEFG